mmetsp:Transcript_21573/g.40608  ORF Transcript_21573/g.40608 Transcript_21573/m.40608 type:complete len:128 (+) Transcript_21573:73-456(+)
MGSTAALPVHYKFECCQDETCREAIYKLPEEMGPTLTDASDYMLQKLQGSWFRKQDGKLMGQIYQNVFIWDSVLKRHDALLVLSPDGESLILAASTLDGQAKHLWGVVTNDAQACIRWDSGEVWLRK